MLRYDTSLIAWRRVTKRPVTLGDEELPEGARLLLVLGAANRDPARFPEPDGFILGRPDGRHHLAFGWGEHFCLGAQLARLQARIVFELLTERMPRLRLVPDQTLEFPANVSFRRPLQLWVES